MVVANYTGPKGCEALTRGHWNSLTYLSIGIAFVKI
jgi:hypothetical protein